MARKATGRKAPARTSSARPAARKAEAKPATRKSAEAEPKKKKAAAKAAPAPRKVAPARKAAAKAPTARKAVAKAAPAKKATAKTSAAKTVVRAKAAPRAATRKAGRPAAAKTTRVATAKSTRTATGKSARAATPKAARATSKRPALARKAVAPAARKAAPAKVAAKRGRPPGKRAAATRLQTAAPPQRFTVSHVNEADFKKDGLRPYALYRDLGVAAATGGLCQAHVIRMVPPCTDEVRVRHIHQAELQLVYVLKGWMKNEFEGHGEQMMSAGTCWLQPPGIKHTVLDYSADLEVLEIIVPADFKTLETD